MRLTMYLLRSDVKADKSVLRNAGLAKPLAVRKVDGLTVVPFLLRGDPKLPGWAVDLDALVDVKSKLTTSESAGAVVLIERGKRVFALTFGTGYHSIDPSNLEPRFGLRVAANLVASRRVRGAQTRGIANNTRDQRTLLPIDGSFSDLDVQVDEDWLRQLSGKPSDSKVASSISGADSLRLTLPSFSLRGIGEKLDEVLEAFESEQFKQNFPFLDQITPLLPSDPRVGKLDALVAQRLRVNDPQLGFSTPDPFDLNEDSFDHYELFLGRPGRFEIDDLDTTGIYDILRQLPPGRDPLQDVTVLALSDEGKLVDKARTLKAYVLAEQGLEGQEYLLTAGLWFVVSHDFVTQVNEQVAKIPDISDELDLPTWDVEELKNDDQDKTNEGSYNIKVAKDRGYALLDKKMAYFSTYEKLEVSDLLTPGGHLLCVKSASDASALSHLVAQAVNSSAAWGSSTHQKVLQKAWQSLPGNNKQSILERKDARYVLAIATPREGPLHDSLFFFTKVLLANGLRSLSGSELSVALAKIPMKVNPPVKKPRKPRTEKP
jgi:uncharacterized protein (TIGR04141 family)